MLPLSLTYRFVLSLSSDPTATAVFAVDAGSIDEAYKEIYAIQLRYADEYGLMIAVSPWWGCYRGDVLVAGESTPLDTEWTWADTYALSAVMV